MNSAVLQSNSDKRFDWAGLGWLYLFYWYFSGVNHVLLQLTGATIFVGLRDATLPELILNAR